jgi:hypothetical protein
MSHWRHPHDTPFGSNRADRRRARRRRADVFMPGDVVFMESHGGITRRFVEDCLPRDVVAQLKADPRFHGPLDEPVRCACPLQETYTGMMVENRSEGLWFQPLMADEVEKYKRAGVRFHNHPVPLRGVA